MFSLLLSLIPGAGIVSAAVQAAFEFLKPVIKVVGEFVAWFLKDIVFEGIKDIFDNLATLLLVIMLMGGTYWYTNNYGPKRTAAEQEIVKLVDQIKCMRAKRCK